MRIFATALLVATTGLGLASAGFAAPASSAPATAYKQIDGGEAFTCGVTTAGAAKCWGQGFSGQLGDGSATNQTRPIGVRGLGSGVVSVAAGEKHACALTTKGLVYCWGSNTSGQLGDGTTSSRYVPVLVRNLGGQAKAVTAGYLHSCAVLTTGSARCWGWNTYGQLGTGTFTSTPLPAPVKGLSGASAIASFHNTTCAVAGAGKLSCWGLNSNGQVGDGSTTDRPTPRPVVGFSSGTRGFAPSVSFTCAVTSGRAAKCWGVGFSGELGDGAAYSKHPTPKPVLGLGTGVAGITTGGTHACATLTSGAARCWGENRVGAVGDGTTVDRYRPAAVKTLTSGVARITGGGSHTCAVLASGAAKCWGENLWGQLGDGTRTTRLIPVTVAG